jgi:predicted LPLAT superfamily acyltransferase
VSERPELTTPAADKSVENKSVAKSPAHWSQVSEAGALTGMRFLFFCFKWGGRPLFKLVLAPVIFYFFLFRKQARAASLDYLRRVQRSGALAKNCSLLWLSARHFWNFGNALVDKLAVWMGQIPREQVQIHGDEIIFQLRAKKQGCVLVISHLGNFEICRCLSARHPGMRLTVLMHTKHAQKFNRLMQEKASASQLDILQVTEITPATAMLLSERIEQGEFVAIAGDRVPISNPENSLLVDFLGDKAPLPSGPFTLASILRAPMIGLFCLREDKGFGIYFKQLSDAQPVPRRQRQQHLQQLAQVYATELEHHCRRQPLQWFNFFDFWQLPQAPAQPEAVPQPQDSPLREQDKGTP